MKKVIQGALSWLLALQIVSALVSCFGKDPRVLRLKALDLEIRSSVSERWAKVKDLATYRVWTPAMFGADPTLTLDDKVKEASAAVEAKRKEAQKAWAEFDEHRKTLAESDVDASDEDSEAFQKAEEKFATYGSLADELSALENRREKLWAMSAEKNGPADTREARERVKDGLTSRESYGDRIVASEEYQKLLASGILNRSSKASLGNVQLGEMMDRNELHALVVTDAEGDNTVRSFIEPQHRGLVEPRFRSLLVLDLITVLQTDSDSIDYVLETGYVNNAAAVPEAQHADTPEDPDNDNEAGVKPQSELSYEKQDAAVKTIAHWIPVTRKSLADVARLRSLIDTRLRRGVLDVLEDQIIDGDGVGENLTGILNTEGIQHQERTTGEPLVDDVLRGMTKLALAFFDPTATGLHPLDWEEIRLQREGDGTGQYLFGPPSQAGATTLWGRPVVSGPQFNENQPVVADWRTIEFYLREGVQVLASDSHADFFIRNLIALLAEMRGAVVVPQPEAICEISEGS